MALCSKRQDSRITAADKQHINVLNWPSDGSNESNWICKISFHAPLLVALFVCNNIKTCRLSFSNRRKVEAMKIYLNVSAYNVLCTVTLFSAQTTLKQLVSSLPACSSHKKIEEAGLINQSQFFLSPFRTPVDEI
jgi:hypothetical protein